ncbi:MAG: ComEC/Rec2 family competence protein [Phycisphaerae bacterium]|nr:ComEC/Rec2 family competence protein [Phycisphaerae bacterium]
MATAENSVSGQRDDDANTTRRERPRPRPLLWPIIALILGIWLSDSIGPVTGGPRTALLVLPFVAFGLLLMLQRRATPVITGFSPNSLVLGLIMVIALLAGFARQQAAIYRPPRHIVHALGDEPVLTRVAGRIITTPIERPAVRRNPFIPFDPSPRTQFVLALEELRTTDPPIPTTGNVRVSVEAVDLSLRLGQTVQLTGKLYRPSGPRNPGERDWSQWYRRQGLDAGMLVEGAAHVAVLPGQAAWYHQLVSAVRGQARSLLFEPYADLEADESQRLLDVMVLGQRSAADRGLNEAFLRAGGMHFLAVSGFHVGVLAGSVWWLMRRVLSRRRRAAGLIVIVVTVLYALIAEPNAPILRAATLVIVAALALMTNRPFCVTNWLALAAGFILICNPNELFRAGFQLSFVQVAGLMTVVPRVQRRLFLGRPDDILPPDAQTIPQLIMLKAKRWLCGLAVVCICAWLTALPLVLLHFGRFAPWGWLGTFLLSPLVFLTIVLSFATLIANAVHPLLGMPLGVLLRWLTEGLLGTVGLFTHFPGAVIECQPPPAGLVFVTYGVLLAMVARQEPRPPGAARQEPRPPGPQARRPVLSIRRIATTIVITPLVLAWLGYLVLPGGNRGPGYTVHVLAVGNGSATVLAAPGGQAAIYDVGTTINTDAGEVAVRAARALGVRRLDTVLISHANFDHYSGLPTVMECITVGRWMTNAYFTDRDMLESGRGRLAERLPTEAAAPAMLQAGDFLKLGDATLEILWPPAGLNDMWETNDTSLVVRLTAGGRTVLLTGDIERDSINALLEAERAGRIDLRADVLIAPHHGAVLKDVTADFYAAVSPSVVVVSARELRPKLEAVVHETLGPGCRIIATGEAGAVVVRISTAGDLRIETPFAK